MDIHIFISSPRAGGARRTITTMEYQFMNDINKKQGVENDTT